MALVAECPSLSGTEPTDTSGKCIASHNCVSVQKLSLAKCLHLARVTTGKVVAHDYLQNHKARRAILRWLCTILLRVRAMPAKPRRSSRSTRPRNRAAASAGTRVKVVWLSLFGAMTAVGALLLMVDGRPIPRGDGLSLSPLAAASFDGHSADPVFNPRKPIQPGRWQAIVIHHSGNVLGTPASIEREHQAQNLRVLGHHFIIGNGNGMDDGQLHLGYRWLEQEAGAHVGGEVGDWYNKNSISICLVGDGNRRPFSQAQLERLETLLDSLCRELQIPRDRILLHSQIAPVADPGKLFPGEILNPTPVPAPVKSPAR